MCAIVSVPMVVHVSVRRIVHVNVCACVCIQKRACHCALVHVHRSVQINVCACVCAKRMSKRTHLCILLCVAVSPCIRTTTKCAMCAVCVGARKQTRVAAQVRVCLCAPKHANT